MSEVDEQAIEVFGSWLKGLADDTRAVVDAIADEGVSAEVRRPLAAAINYLFKSLDLIDDGIEGLGFMDDAFVLRLACRNAGQQGELPESLRPLAADAALVEGFLGDLSARMNQFVDGLLGGTVRGRSVEGIVEDVGVREDVVGDARGWAGRYEAPKFVLDEQGLVKLRSFLAAKLPE